MSYKLEPFADLGSGAGLSESLLETLIAQHESTTVPTLRTLWSYYRNPMTLLAGATSVHADGSPAAGRAYRLGQERGLPARLSGRAGRIVGIDGSLPDDRMISRREIVIENDIAWRIHAMVDFMFGKPVTLLSRAREESMRRTIERALESVWEASGGIGLLQDIGLLGHIYGHVDLIVRRPDASATDSSLDAAARTVRIDPVEPKRGVPLTSASDFRTLDAYILRFQREAHTVSNSIAPSLIARIVGAGRREPSGPRRDVVTVTEILSATHWQIYEDHGHGPTLVAEGPNDVTPGRTPVVHIQNVSQPFTYAGMSEVEPLIPLQDELNTRLSDRASRVTMQSFRMFLAKGIDGFDRAPVGPGQVWSTDNPDASIEAFGGNAEAGGEDEHIEQVREGMDKASAVPPLASGVVRAKIGNLTSENALRVTLTGLLSKTARKRITYGRGIAEACRLILDALDEAGVLKTDPEDRGVHVEWPDPLPRDETVALMAAKTKIDLGVPRERVLSELGYAPADPGVL